MVQNITEKQKEMLQSTKMEDGTSAWEYVLTKKPESQYWIAAGIQSCIEKGYNLNPMVVNWEARDLRYAQSQMTKFTIKEKEVGDSCACSSCCSKVDLD